MVTRKLAASPVKVTGRTPEGQPFESALEEDFFVLLRFRPDVVRWQRNEEVVEWRDGDQVRAYTPDALFEVRTTTGAIETHLVEVKPDFDADDPRPKARLPRRESDEDNRKKWDAASHFALLQGWRFSVVREREIRTPYLENAKFLMRHKQGLLELDGRDGEHLRLLQARERLTLAQWVDEAARSPSERDRLWASSYRLIAQGRVHADLSRERINLNTLCVAREH